MSLSNKDKFKNTNMPKKILFINQEITPYVPESAMALLGQQLPESIQAKGYEIRTFMPKWGTINERRDQLHEVIRLSGMNIVIGGNDHPLLIKVASIPVSRVQVYFIDNDEFFKKRGMGVDESGNEYKDNGERAIFFARGVLETVKKLRWAPDVIVCQGWMAAVVPVYLKKIYSEEPCFANTKVVTSLFDTEMKCEFGDQFKSCVEFQEVTTETLAEYKDSFDFVELGKMALDNSDGVVVATEQVNAELMDYAKNKNLPVLNYPGENFGEAYQAFFEKLTE